MSNDAGAQALWRSIVGQPRIWQGVIWTAIGLVWIVLAVERDGLWRWVLGGVWLVIGVVWLLIAVSDRRHGRGRYAGRPGRPERPERTDEIDVPRP